MSTLTAKIKLNLSGEAEVILPENMSAYISAVNDLAERGAAGEDISVLTSKSVSAPIPSAARNQCIRDAKSVLCSYKKRCEKAAAAGKDAPNLPVLKKKVLYINNQNWSFDGASISIPLFDGEKCRRFEIPAEGLQHIPKGAAKGILRIALKGKEIYAFAAFKVEDPPVPEEGCVMGVDLGIKCPAVSYCDGKVKFYGNGRQNKAVRRKYASRRKKLQKHKNHKAVKRTADKEQRYMRDVDHKVSRAVVNEAKRLGANEIRLEVLSGIRRNSRSTGKSRIKHKTRAAAKAAGNLRKYNRSLNSWSFSRLAGFICYKASLAGIRVVFVNPKDTSQICPACGRKNHADDRTYRCACGFKGHRDAVGAINISKAKPVKMAWAHR